MRNRTLKCSSLLFASALATLLGLRAARAAGDAPPAGGAEGTQEASATDRAAALYREGNTLYDQSKFAEAEEMYQSAWDIQRSFDVAGNLGNVELELSQYREAAEHLSYAIAIFPLGDGPEKKVFLEKRLALAKAQIGTLNIRVNVDGADVFVDDRNIGRSPLEGPVFVDPGPRVIKARRGDEVTSVSLVVAKGSEDGVSLRFDTGPSLPVVVSGGVVGLLGVASGVTFAILANGKSGEAEEARGAERGDLLESQTLLANVSFWSFVGGGAVLAGTAAYALTTALAGGGAKGASAGLRAAPMITATGGGLAVGGSF